MGRYYCSKCKHFHYRGQIFNEHKIFKIDPPEEDGGSKEQNVEAIMNLQKRIDKLEQNIEYLLSNLEKKNQKILKRMELSKEREINPIKKPTLIKEIETLDDIKEFITSILKPGDSINIDNLIKLRELQTSSFSMLKEAINNLIQKGILSASKGDSIQKIDGTIGKLTRTKNE
jgi:hypothetical protein